MMVNFHDNLHGYSVIVWTNLKRFCLKPASTNLFPKCLNVYATILNIISVKNNNVFQKLLNFNRECCYYISCLFIKTIKSSRSENL